MLVLEVHDGGTRRTVSLEADAVRIGRHPDCELYLAGDPSISRVHAVVTTGPDGWRIEDAGSRNGTRVNGQPLVDGHLLQEADRVTLGQVVLVVRHPAEDGFVETVAADEVVRQRVQTGTGLSAREVDVLRLLCAGATDEAIAAELFISVKTVHSHLDRIRAKTGHRRRPELIRFGLAHGIG
jgi:DNA-binding CsgD family transcriptional regulator